MDKANRQKRLPGLLAGLAMEVAPQVAAIAAFLGGAVMLASAATPVISERVDLLSEVAPIVLIELSHFAASIVGVLLMFVGSGLWRRREGAFWVALILLLAGAGLSLTKGLEYGVSLLLLVVAALLWTARKAFDRPSRLRAGVGPFWLAATTAAVIGAGELGAQAYRDVPYRDALWWTFVQEGDASRFLRAGVAVGMLITVAALWTLFSPPRRRRGLGGPDELQKVAGIIAADGLAPANAAIQLLGDKEFFFSDSGASVIGFRQRGPRWIALGPPLGPREERVELMWRFVEVADRYGASAVFYQAPARLLPDLAALGLVIRLVGEEAVVRTETFTISGKGKQNLRTACNKAAALGVVFEVLPPGSASPLDGELRAISDAWLAEHAGEEKAFSMGRYDVAYLDRSPLALVRHEGRIIAFANILVGGQAVLIDLMRFVEPSPHGIMDYLFVKVIEWARAEGYPEVSLGVAPLSGLQNRRLAPLFARLGALVYAEANAFYSFGGLHAYKSKFGPEWRPIYMAARPGTPLPLALLDVALLTGGGWRGVFLKG
jgi:phosphatidylglycerol lysyltransferase